MGIGPKAGLVPHRALGRATVWPHSGNSCNALRWAEGTGARHPPREHVPVARLLGRSTPALFDSTPSRRNRRGTPPAVRQWQRSRIKASDRSRLVRGGLRSHGATHDGGRMYCTPQIHESELRNNLGRADQATRSCQASEGLCFAAGPHRPPFSRLRTTLLWGRTENGPADNIARSRVLALPLTKLRTKL